MSQNSYNIFIVGVGGQGVLTIGELITEAAFKKGIHANFYPTKGMSQRGGFVKAELRLGQEGAGPSIPAQGADLIISMELSETIKAIRYAKEKADFMVYGAVWAPTAVMLGKAPYPTLEQVWGEIEKAEGKISYLKADNLPCYQDLPVRENIYLLGATLAQTGLKEIFTEEEMITAITERWPKGAAGNLFAFKAGLAAQTYQELAGAL